MVRSAKRVESGLKTFFKEELLRRPGLDPRGLRARRRSAKSKEAGATIKAYVRFGLGEGVKGDGADFASEVAAAAGL